MSNTAEIRQVPVPAEPAPRNRKRFERKREEIVIAATGLINRSGIKAMTLLEVAQMVGLNATSVTYYFRRKELLAATVFEQSLQRLEAMVIAAAGAATAQERVARFIALNVELRAQVIRGEDRPLAKLWELRTLDDELRVPLTEHYCSIFRQVREFFGTPDDELHKALLTARAHMLLEVVFWLPVWISRYDLVDFPRVQARLLDIVNHGLTPSGSPWTAQPLPLPVDPTRPDGRESFLRVATRLINDLGYRGASVGRIVEELNVTKGSFYHHLDAKDDLVLDCFRRSYGGISIVQSLADQAGGDGWTRISRVMATLLDVQFGAEWPLLRTTALQALPPALRAEVIARSDRMALRFSGTLVDGIADGSLRPVDPNIASQLIVATINTAYDLHTWAARVPRAVAIAFYASTLVNGLFDDGVLTANHELAQPT
jgi:AcrR family transcriptional regulator